jgi:hypothetical protein
MENSPNNLYFYNTTVKRLIKAMLMFEKLNKEKQYISTVRQFKLWHWKSFKEGFIFELSEKLQDELMIELSKVYNE